MIKILSIQEVKEIAFELARETMSWDAPMPDFNTRFPNILESCLTTPFQTFDKKHLYKGSEEKAAILFYLMIKNHPFSNGNKRIAVTILLVFFYLNGKWLKISNQELYNFAVWVASSPPQVSEETIQAIKRFINKNVVGF
ncbi:MAG: type II toxin-antitoxin system death-on-curing family toxin [Deltaproteobacteria bacterium]|nr:type II toxin-antitoxin system death-on-curing family toxin [Deltaproteobacteria bacterium]